MATGQTVTQVTLKSSEGVSITVGELSDKPRYSQALTHSMHVARDVAERSILIKNMIEDMGEEAFAEEQIPIPNVSLDGSGVYSVRGRAI